MKYFADEENNPFFNDTRMVYLIHTCYKNIQIRNRSFYFCMSDSNIVIRAKYDRKHKVRIIKACLYP